MIELRLAHPAPILNVLMRMHWRKRKRYAKQVAMELHIQLRKLPKRHPMEKCRVKIVRRSTGMPDWDGLFACPKIPMDCLVVPSKTNPHGLGLIKDDNPKCVISMEVVPEQVSKSQDQETIIYIQEVDEAGNPI